MTMVLTDRTTSYDGSPSGSNNIYTATGPIVVTFSKDRKRDAVLMVWSRSDTADYVKTTPPIDQAGRYRIELVSGDNFYFTVEMSEDTGSVDLSYVDA